MIEFAGEVITGKDASNYIEVQRCHVTLGQGGEMKFC